MQSRKSFGRSACALAAASVVIAGAQSALGAYGSVTSFVPNINNVAPYVWNDAVNLNWDNGISTATSLVQIANTAAISSGGNMVAYGIEFTSTGGSVTLTPSPSTDVLTLLSMDSVSDPGNGLAFALSNITSATGTLELRPAIQLGDGSVSSGTFYFNNTRADGALNIYHKIVEAPGTTMGVTLVGTNRIELRGGTNSGNYLVNRYQFSGPFTIAAGAHARVYNNLLPSGVGLPNVQINGQFRQSANGNAIILNAIDSADSSATISRQAGNDLVIGANNGNGDFSGVFNSSSTRLVKVGAGTQVLSNAASVFGAMTLLGGTVSVDSIADSATASAAGGGGNGGSFTYNSVSYPIPGTQFDGGTLRYTGTGHSSNRSMGVSFRGGTIEASGSGALVLSGTFTSNDFARVYGDSLESGTSQVISNMYGLNGLASLASQLVIAEAGTSISGAVGTTPVTIDENARTLELAPGATVGTAGNGFGAPQMHLLSTVGLPRTLTLAGTSTADNEISGVLADSALAGGVLSIAKNDSGKWILSGNNTYTGTTNVNAGTLIVNGTNSGTGAVNVASSATLGGSGSVAGSVVSSGKIAPGNSAGTLSIGGTLTMDTAASLAVELESLASFDKLVVSGAASVAGSMTIDLLGAYEPAHSDTFTVLTSGGLTGTFANTNAWGLITVTGGGKAMLSEYTATDVILTEFTKVGDVDFDGVINNQDIGPFVAVLTGTPPVAPSALGFAADVDGNGVVNNQDIGPFVALLTGSRPLAELANDPDFAPLIALVPEPTSLSLLALGGLALRRRRR